MRAAKPSLGFLGLGAMGGPMARHLLAAGYPLVAYDRNAERLRAAVAAGAVAADDTVPPGGVADVVARSEVVCLSLPSSEAVVEVFKDEIMPRAGQVFIDFGTTAPPETRRIAAELAGRGAALIDAPVSGGPGGAERARLRMFVGGDAEAVERCRPILETVGGSEGLTYCGPSGAGQVVKGVNQLAMGLGAAAYLEAVAFGVRAGVGPEIIATAVGDPDERWRAIVLQMAEAAAKGTAEQVGVKFRELPYFLREAREGNFPLPLTETLYGFCDGGERVVVDDNRPAPSFWHELMVRIGSDDNDYRNDD